MFRAGRYFETHEEYEYALEFLRRASQADPWREDVYQGIMRCSMHSGRRSGAIETFLTCRSRLCEDLGIDPSAETMRLYDAVLAMDADSAQPYGEVETIVPGRTRFTSG
jgi:DNA-binding SARP family transcriptional activator